MKHFRFKGTIKLIEGSTVTIESFEVKEALSDTPLLSNGRPRLFVEHEGPYSKEPTSLPADLIGKTVRIIG